MHVFLFWWYSIPSHLSLFRNNIIFNNCVQRSPYAYRLLNDTFLISFISLYIFLVHTDAKSPSDYCNIRNSPARLFPRDKYGNEIYPNEKHYYLPSLQSKQLTLNDNQASTSNVYNIGKSRDFNLNEFPLVSDDENVNDNEIHKNT